MVGGPVLSIEVNSSSTTAVPSSTGTIDLSKGGPSHTGSDLGVLGGVGPAPPGSFMPGTTGAWVYPHLPISDPFYNLPVPPLPLAPCPVGPSCPAGTDTNTLLKCARSPCPVAFNDQGCPDHTQATSTYYGITTATAGGCLEFAPGLYTSPIVLKDITAIFDPGVYYVTGTTTTGGNCPNMPCRYGLDLEDKSIVRPSTATGDGSGGAMFYFTSTASPAAGTYGSVYAGSNAGDAKGSRVVDDFGVTPTGGASALATCAGGASPDPLLALPATFKGNVFLAPCTGTYGQTDSNGLPARGMALWDDRDNADLGGQPSMQGGGQMLLGGAMYFHNCASKDGRSLGTNCSPATNPPTAGSGYQAFFQMQGSSGSTSYIIGYLITDALATGGGATFAMSINKNLLYPILKATMVQ